MSEIAIPVTPVETHKNRIIEKPIITKKRYRNGSMLFLKTTLVKDKVWSKGQRNQVYTSKYITTTNFEHFSFNFQMLQAQEAN